MDIKEKENRKKFKDLLYELGSSLDVLKSPYKRSEIYTRLESLYHNTDFRHYYSDIFSVLTTINLNYSRHRLIIASTPEKH